MKDAHLVAKLHAVFGVKSLSNLASEAVRRVLKMSLTEILAK
jgi:hypothetical protein